MVQRIKEWLPAEEHILNRIIITNDSAFTDNTHPIEL